MRASVGIRTALEAHLRPKHHRVTGGDLKRNAAMDEIALPGGMERDRSAVRASVFKRGVPKIARRSLEAGRSPGQRSFGGVPGNGEGTELGEIEIRWDGRFVPGGVSENAEDGDVRGCCGGDLRIVVIRRVRDVVPIKGHAQRDGRGTELLEKRGVRGGESVIVDADGLGADQRGGEREHTTSARARKRVYGHLEKLSFCSYPVSARSE